MFNSLKSDFLCARWLAFVAEDETLPDSGSYSDSLDYAVYGMNSSLLTLAQRSCLDVLDKLAIATSEYLNLTDLSPTKVTFQKRWHTKTGDKVEWHQAIAREIHLGNSAPIALAEIAEDLALEGYLNPKRGLRNSSTHRFTILHDEGFSISNESGYVNHFDHLDFTNHLISTLQLVRSALVYFVEMVSIREARLSKDSDALVMPMAVPSHHYVRGEDDAEV